MLYCFILYCIVLYCTVLLCCIVLYCVVLCCVVLRLYCAELHCNCTALHCIALYCIVLNCAVLCYAVLRLHCTALHCIALYFIVCTVLMVSLYLPKRRPRKRHCVQKSGKPTWTINNSLSVSSCLLAFLILCTASSPGLFHLSREKKPWGRGWLCLYARSVKGKLFPFGHFNYNIKFLASAFPVEGLHQSTLAVKTRTVIKLAEPSP